MDVVAPSRTRPAMLSRAVAVVAVLALAAAVVPASPAQAQDQEPPFNRGLAAACPPEAQTHDVFPDVVPNGHWASINCIAFFGISLGQTAPDGTTIYGPRESVTREQMASFVARTMARADFEFPAGDMPFDDISHAHHDNVARLYAAGIVEGRADGTYGPRVAVTRQQMASYIARMIEAHTGEALPTATVFADRGAAAHATNVDKLTAIGVVQGRADGTFGPRADITREQMASFIARAMDYLAEQGVYD